jgi:CRISPR-associated protein (TIGR02710 family)
MAGQEESQRSRVMLVSLGGSPEPVLLTLNRQQPEYVLFFISATSAREVQGVVGGLEYGVAAFEQILTPSAELLHECYRALRDQLPERLRHWGLTFSDLTVDYTGGTKSMSAALVLATADRVHRYSYVGGVERDKGGLGVVISGREKMWFLQNPWRELVRDELARIVVLFANARYLGARNELSALADRADADAARLLAALVDLAAGLASWDSFRHADAKVEMGRAYAFLKVFALGARQPRWSALTQGIAESLDFLKRIPGHGSDAASRAVAGGETLILDLVANADRRARIEHKYEDAVARLYSCVERAARFRLFTRSPAIDNEKVAPEQVPAALREELVRRYGESGGRVLRLPLEASYQLLAALGDPLGAAFAARAAQVGRLLALRNHSILGHGEEAVTQAGYDAFRRFVVELLDLREETLPRFPEVRDLELG